MTESFTYCNPDGNTKESSEETVPIIDCGCRSVQERDCFLDQEWINNIKADFHRLGHENKKEFAGEARKQLDH